MYQSSEQVLRRIIRNLNPYMSGYFLSTDFVWNYWNSALESRREKKKQNFIKAGWMRLTKKKRMKDMYEEAYYEVIYEIKKQVRSKWNNSDCVLLFEEEPDLYRFVCKYLKERFDPQGEVIVDREELYMRELIVHHLLSSYHVEDSCSLFSASKDFFAEKRKHFRDSYMDVGNALLSALFESIEENKISKKPAAVKTEERQECDSPTPFKSIEENKISKKPAAVKTEEKQGCDSPTPFKSMGENKISKKPAVVKSKKKQGCDSCIPFENIEENKSGKKPVAVKTEKSQEYDFSTPGLSQWITFGRNGYGEVAAVVLNKPAENLHKVIVNHNGRFENFPGIVQGKWTKFIEGKFDFDSGSICFRTEFRLHEDGYRCLWEIQPDGRYWADEYGFGAEKDSEIILYADLDGNGNFITPFQIYKIDGKRVE